MLLMQFSFEVPEHKIQEFLEYSSTVLKSTWESYGCKSYIAYRNVARRIRPDQILNENEVVELLAFDSMEAVEKMFDRSNIRPEHLDAVKSYTQRFSVRNMQSRLLQSSL